MKQRQSGFTLVEIAIVVVVIAMLAAMIIWSFGIVQKRSRDDSRNLAARTLMAALKTYYDENGEYPGVCTGGDNSGCPISDLAPALTPKYLSVIPSDPSGRSFSYTRGTYPNRAYALLISYESQPTCKTGVDWMGNFSYNTSINTWWGSTSVTPICADPAPDKA